MSIAGHKRDKPKPAEGMNSATLTLTQYNKMLDLKFPSQQRTKVEGVGFEYLSFNF
jgi:hypothetical protein